MVRSYIYLPPTEYTAEKQEQLKALAERIGESHYSKSSVEKQREEQARQLEDDLRTHLNEIVTEIVQEDSSDISLLKRQYDTEVEHVIRAAAHNAYSVGVNYVGGIKKRPHHMFITATDIGHIKKITADYVEVFWRRVGAVLHQKDTVQNIIKSSRFSTRSRLSLANLISSLAAKVITKSIASATIVKVNALRTVPPSIKQAQEVDILVWHTQHDEKVCPLCASLDGMEWHSDDPNMLVPPDDSHSNCRCALDLKAIFP